MRSNLESRQRWGRTEKRLAELTSYPPSGCGRCGHREYCHFLGNSRTVSGAWVGSHAYQHPTDEQIKTRMLTRRTARHPNNPRGSMTSQPEPPSALDDATARWHETNLAIGEASGNGTPPDPYRYAALLDARAGWWDHLGQLADRAAGVSLGMVRDVYAIACTYAAELDRNDAATVRFQHRIPTLHPGVQATRLGLDGSRERACTKCRRPWQLDREGACEACPGLMWGVTPHSRHEVASYPPGQPWTPPERGWEDDGD